MPLAVEQHAGGDEIAVEADGIGVAHQRRQVAPHQRLAAREMHLQHAQRGRLAEDALPGCGVELGAGALQLQRVGAIRAAQRTAMRELRKERQRRADGSGPAASWREHAFVDKVLQHRRDVGGDRGARCVELRASIVDHLLDAPRAVDSRKISTASSSGTSTRSGASTTHWLARLIVTEVSRARQARPLAPATARARGFTAGPRRAPPKAPGGTRPGST